MSLVTPLNRVLGLGSAKDGVEHWRAQRLSAVALALLGLWLVVAFIGLADLRYDTVVTWLQAPSASILMILTLLTLGYHSQLGVRILRFATRDGVSVFSIIWRMVFGICSGISAGGSSRCAQMSSESAPPPSNPERVRSLR